MCILCDYQTNFLSCTIKRFFECKLAFYCQWHTCYKLYSSTENDTFSRNTSTLILKKPTNTKINSAATDRWVTTAAEWSRFSRRAVIGSTRRRCWNKIQWSAILLSREYWGLCADSWHQIRYLWNTFEMH